jgi:hypothetical protein
MDTSLEHSILQAFKECQQWTQQFIVDDSGGTVDLSCAATKLSPQTHDNAKNQPPSYPDRSVYRFDPSMYRGKESFQALVLMIQNSLPGSILVGNVGVASCRRTPPNDMSFADMETCRENVGNVGPTCRQIMSSGPHRRRDMSCRGDVSRHVGRLFWT